MSTIKVCKHRKFELKFGTLYLRSNSIVGNQAWVDSFTIEQAMRAIAEEPNIGPEYPVTIVRYIGSIDELYPSTGFVTFAGGDRLYDINFTADEDR